MNFQMIVEAAKRQFTFRTSAAKSLQKQLKANSFELISKRPYLAFDASGKAVADYKKPFIFPADIVPVSSQNVETPVWVKTQIGCADDICMVALTLEMNMDARAAGINYTLKEAVLEASRTKEAEHCKYILFEEPLHKRGEGKNTVILENTAAQDSDKALLVKLRPQTPYQLY